METRDGRRADRPFATARAAWRDLKTLRKAWRFVPLADLVNYRRLLRGDGRRLVGVRIRNLGLRTVWARSGTNDPGTLASVFRDQFHLPPAPLPDAPVILDLGCNCGYTIAHYKHLHPRARVVGVEMDEGNLDVARRNVDGLEDVDLVLAAVSRRDGVVSYDTGNGVDAYRVAPSGGPDPGLLATVQAISMPSLLRRFGLTRIDFAKIDIEGEEVGLFDAAGDLGWLDTVDSLNMEVHAGRPVLEALLTALRERGFRAWKDGRHWSAIMAVRPGVAASRAPPRRHDRRAANPAHQEP